MMGRRPFVTAMAAAAAFPLAAGQAGKTPFQYDSLRWVDESVCLPAVLAIPLGGLSVGNRRS